MPYLALSISKQTDKTYGERQREPAGAFNSGLTPPHAGYVRKLEAKPLEFFVFDYYSDTPE
jgi:hypothetical protein